MPVTKDQMLHDFKWGKLMVCELYPKAVKKATNKGKRQNFFITQEAYTIFINIIHKISI